MKSSRPNLYLLAVIILLFAIIILWPSKTSRQEAQPSAQVPSRGQSAERNSEEVQPFQVDRALSTHGKAEQENLASMDIASVKARIVAEKNAQMYFWGLIKDQNEIPLQGVRVVFRVRSWITKSSSTEVDSVFSRIETRSDLDGRFQLIAAHGDSLTFETIEKEGFQLSPSTIKTYSFGPAANKFAPDASNPVVFHMWKLQPGEPVKSFHLSSKIPYDGTDVTVDLHTGKISYGALSSSADLKLKLSRNPLVLSITNRQAFDWEFVITGMSCSLFEAEDEFMYLAPTDGYQRQLEIVMNRSSPQWKPSETFSFFVKGNEGQFYGQVTLEIRANYSGATTGLTLDARLNEYGSRNLQPKN